MQGKKKCWGWGMPLLSVALLVFQLSCGDDEKTTTDTGTTSGDTVAVNDLSTLPSLNLKSGDTTTSISALSSSSPSSSLQAATAVNATSPAGCMATTFFKPQALSSLKQAEMFKCFPEETQRQAASTATPIVIPTGSYGFFDVSLGSLKGVQNAPKEVKVKMGNFVDANGNATFKMEMCETQDGSTFAKNHELEISGDKSTKKWSGFVTGHFNIGSGKYEFNTTTFEIGMKTGDDFAKAFDFTNVNTFKTTSYFGRNASTADVSSSTTYEDGFRLNFDYYADCSAYPDFAVTSTSACNRTIGSFAAGSGAASGLMYALFNATQGAAKMTFTQGGTTAFNDTEAFDPTKSPPTVVATSAVPFYAGVAALTLPATISVPTELNNSVAFKNSWDCTAPSGSSFTVIDASTFDYSKCLKMGSEVSDAKNSCFGGGGGGSSGSVAGTYNVNPAGTCSFVTTGEKSVTLAGSATPYTMTSGSSTGALSMVESSKSCTFSLGSLSCTCEFEGLQFRNVLAGTCTDGCAFSVTKKSSN